MRGTVGLWRNSQDGLKGRDSRASMSDNSSSKIADFVILKLTKKTLS